MLVSSVKGVGFVLNFTRYQFIEDFDGFIIKLISYSNFRILFIIHSVCYFNNTYVSIHLYAPSYPKQIIPNVTCLTIEYKIILDADNQP